VAYQIRDCRKEALPLQSAHQNQLYSVLYHEGLESYLGIFVRLQYHRDETFHLAGTAAAAVAVSSSVHVPARDEFEQSEINLALAVRPILQADPVLEALEPREGRHASVHAT
jgi:hypothetical protein